MTRVIDPGTWEGPLPPGFEIYRPPPPPPVYTPPYEPPLGHGPVIDTGPPVPVDQLPPGFTPGDTGGGGGGGGGGGASPKPPRYKLSTDPNYILARAHQGVAAQAAAHANAIAAAQLADRLAGRGLGRSGENVYQSGELAYRYGQQMDEINNAPGQAVVQAWQWAMQHPELYSGIDVTDLPPEWQVMPSG